MTKVVNDPGLRRGRRSMEKNKDDLERGKQSGFYNFKQVLVLRKH
jgi:hypothetical protein